MKIAVPADEPSLEARVQNKLGTTPYLLVVDPDDMSFEVLDGPPPSLGSGAGVQALSIVLGKGANVILVGYISPNISKPLQKNGIEVVTSVSGSVREAVMQYKCGGFALAENCGRKSGSKLSAQQNSRWAEALRKTAKQYSTLIPVLTGVILLTGLFKAFIPKELLLTMFSGSMIQDTFAGAFIGSLLSGNPINSYVIGETFLEIGVDFFGVTAMMLTWVTVWLVQIPVEVSVFGTRFTLIRNVAAFLIAIPASILIVWLSGGAS
ncbi:NifB/NifX family molybdenum-iron cluster-binding protein [Thermodesulfobacteriota bacterium]